MTKNETDSFGTETRRCTGCGKPVDSAPYRFWLFHTCQSCAIEATPKRWGLAGTSRKWRYYPDWHRQQQRATT